MGEILVEFIGKHNSSNVKKLEREIKKVTGVRFAEETNFTKYSDATTPAHGDSFTGTAALKSKHEMNNLKNALEKKGLTDVEVYKLSSVFDTLKPYAIASIFTAITTIAIKIISP